MATESTFDIVSEFDYQELLNAVDQTRREVTNRYDLKDSRTTLDVSQNELVMTTESEMHLTSVRDILETRALRRNLSIKIFDYGKIEEIGAARVRQTAALRQGISSDLAKKIQKMIRDQFPKVQARIQGDALRVGSKSKDELQKVIQFMREQQDQFDVPLQFTNYR